MSFGRFFRIDANDLISFSKKMRLCTRNAIFKKGGKDHEIDAAHFGWKYVSGKGD